MEALTEFLAALLVDRRNVLSHVGIAQLQLRAGQPRGGGARGARGAGARSRPAGGALCPGNVADAARDRPTRRAASWRSSSGCRRQAAAESQRKFELDGCGAQVADRISVRPTIRRRSRCCVRSSVSEPDVASHYVTLGLSQMKIGAGAGGDPAFEAALQRSTGRPERHPLPRGGLPGRRPPGREPPGGGPLSRIDRGRQEARAFRFGNPQGAAVSPVALAQKSNCTLTFHNRPSTMRWGCCQAAKLLFRIRSAFELNRL